MRNSHSQIATGVMLLLLLSSDALLAQQADQQPADKPAGQPADQPAAQPTDQPAEQAGEQPAGQPAAGAAEKPALPEIPDEPKTVDPATFMPPKLAEPVTVDFTDSSIGEVAEWIRTQHGFPVLIDERSLSDNNVLVSDPVSDRLVNEPLYLLLDRLRLKGLAWYVEDNILRITTKDQADEHLTTSQYLVGDLFDADYDSNTLIDVIQNETSGPWFDVDGIGGTIVLLGDVMFVRQTDRMQREVAGLLSALRKHGRMTFTLDPPQNLALRQKLQQNVTADFDATPLVTALQNLAEQAEANIRLDTTALRTKGVRERQPVSLALADRPLDTVLSLLLSTVRLKHVIRDGAILITTPENAEELFKTAIYDVRDLCRDSDESKALTDAIQDQTSGPWFDLDGIGGTISFPKPGAMVIRHTEQQLFEILDLLETYRAALRLSKPREHKGIDMNEFITTYYRVEADIADDLVNVLPVLVRPDTWRSEVAPDAKGTILKVASKSDLRDVYGRTVVAAPERNEQDRSALVVAQSVLIIHQSRVAQDEIAKVIHRVQEGDATGGAMGGMMGGMGGFGGGFFSTE